MERKLGMLAAALMVGVTATGTALAHDSFAISIGVPGASVGYANGGYGFAYAAPPLLPAPAAVYYGAPYAYYAGPRVVYAAPYARFYGPYAGYRYWRR